MSRVSRKSELSPSITKSGGGIDLGKNDFDMGRKGKTSPSVTSGGIGVSTEVTNVGGLTVTGGVSVDISPIDLGINYDPSENSLGIAGGAQIPGGLLGASAGITINLDTGEVIGGQVGGEALGLGVNISASKDGGLGVEFTVQIPFTPIEISLGFGYSPEETPTPTPTPTPKAPSSNNPKRIPTSKSCTDGKYELVGIAWTQEDRQNRIYPLEDALARRDAQSELFSNYDKSYEDDFADRAFGKDKWYTTRMFVTSATGGGAWLYIPNSNNILGTPGYIARYDAICEVTYQYDVYLPKGSHSPYYAFGSQAFNYKSVIVSASPPPQCPNPLPPPPLFPNPPPRKQNRMDNCCKENLKFLRVIYDRLGLAKFPGKLPNTIIQEIPKEGEQPAEPPQVPITDLVSLLSWQFERDDERWGQWEIQINIKDADLTKEGNQGKSVKFPNLAESVAEMEGQMLSIQANVEALVALSIRNLTESGMARQEAIKGYLASRAIAKYMAFPYKEFDVEIPSTYTPGATSIDKLIIESIVHAKGIEYEDKETQRDLLLDLLQAAAIIRAVHWRQVNPKNDIKEQILSQLRGSVDLSEKITNVKAVAADGDTPPKKESWEDKLDQYENGFGFSTGIEDANTPYGRDRERRPRIRQIGDNIAQAGKDE
jgi:hypothetical protein